MLKVCLLIWFSAETFDVCASRLRGLGISSISNAGLSVVFTHFSFFRWDEFFKSCITFHSCRTSSCLFPPAPSNLAWCHHALESGKETLGHFRPLEMEKAERGRDLDMEECSICISLSLQLIWASFVSFSKQPMIPMISVIWYLWYLWYLKAI